jgi:flagellar motor switch protein FliG
MLEIIIMNATQDNSLRKVAILIASLDEAWSERILATLTPQQARSVRHEVELLGEIDPREQREIVAEFRRSLAKPEAQPAAQPTAKSSAGVELDASLLKRLDQDDYSIAASHKDGFRSAVTAADAEFLVEMLTGESIQMVALVISRLDTDQAAAVLDKFAPQQQTEILKRLEELDTTDEQALWVVEAQVGQWIVDQRQRRERMAAGKQMVERIVSRTSVAQRESFVAQRESLNQDTVYAARLPKSVTANLPRQVRYEPVPLASQPALPSNPFGQLTAAECLAQLERLSNTTLLAALSRSESHIVSLALVGVSEKLLKRVLRGLSRRDANQFRQQLRDIGPTRLDDILTAQKELLHTASQLA